MGRNFRNSDAPAAENMLPKLLDVPISTYLMVLAKIRRPSATPSASTSRSFSSRITSAASFATSVAESTEMPTSAACRASASLTPSPRKATPPPLRRWARTMRALSWGLTRANTVVATIAAESAESSIPSRSAPVSALSAFSPRSRQTLTATAALSPVTTLTAIPRPASRRSALAASCLGGSRNTSSPTRCRPRSSCAIGPPGPPGAAGPAAGRTATATARLQAENYAVSAARSPRGVRAGRRTDSYRDAPVAGGELRCQRVPCASRHVDAPVQDRLRRTFGDHGQLARRVTNQDRDHAALVIERQHPQPRVTGQRGPLARRGRGFPERLIERVPAHGVPVGCRVLGAQEPPPQHCVRAVVTSRHGAGVIDAALGEGAGLVGEQHVDVAEVLDAHQPFDEHLAAAHPT